MAHEDLRAQTNPTDIARAVAEWRLEKWRQREAELCAVIKCIGVVLLVIWAGSGLVGLWHTCTRAPPEMAPLRPRETPSSRPLAGGGLVFEGVWSPDAAYRDGSMVVYNNTIYMAVRSPSASGRPDNYMWFPIVDAVKT